MAGPYLGSFDHLTAWHQVRSAGKDTAQPSRGRSRRRGSPEARYIAWFLDACGTMVATDTLADRVGMRSCVLLLDEVATQYEAVRDELLRFADERTADLPTAQARLIVTCRRHNYLRIRPDWAATAGPSGVHPGPAPDPAGAGHVGRAVRPAAELRHTSLDLRPVLDRGQGDAGAALGSDTATVR